MRVGRRKDWVLSRGNLPQKSADHIGLTRLSAAGVSKSETGLSRRLRHLTELVASPCGHHTAINGPVGDDDRGLISGFEQIGAVDREGRSNHFVT